MEETIEVTFKADSEATFFTTLVDNGDLIDLYFNGWFIACIHKSHLSKEAINLIKTSEATS